MLRYGDLSDGKMKFLRATIEKFSILETNFYYPGSTYRNFLTYPDSSSQDRDLSSPCEGFKYYRWSPPSEGVGEGSRYVEVPTRVDDILPESVKKSLKIHSCSW